MYVPSTSLELPIYYREFLNGHDEVKLHINDKCFWGIITDLTENKENETISVSLDHVVHEWEYRQISVNNAIKDQNMNVVFKGAIVEKTGNENVSANDFTIYSPEVGNLSLEQYITRAGATAWAYNGDPIEITSIDDSAVKIMPDDYEVKFLVASGASVTVTMTVRNLPGARTHKSSKTGITIVAVPFEIAYDETITDADIIERSYALAYDEEGNKVALPGIKSEIGSEPGEYDVEFVISKNDKLKITVTRLEEGEEPTDPFPFIKPWIVDPSVIDELADIYADKNFAYPGWYLNYQHGAEDYIIDYVYSRQNKLRALTKTMELTPDLFWRVRFVNERVIDISPFGDEKQWIISKKPSGVNNIRMISEPTIRHDFSHVINVATVYSEKSDTGMSSMTLREVYEDPSLQIEGFPVVILRANVNNERDYRMYSEQYPKLAPNNELEYAVIDEESVALESGTLIEGTFAFNDLSPFSVDDETTEVTDEDRIKAAKVAYDAAVKKLIQARRTYDITLETEELPAELAPGDKVRFIYENNLYILEECSAYLKRLLAFDDWFYITDISYRISDGGVETNSITLSKYLKIDREVTE